MTTQLTDFIAHARKKGMDHQTIRMLLLSSGWKEKDIAQALTQEALDIPVPVPTDSGGAREAFFHLLMFASFYTTIISTVVLFFSYINRAFPDAATDSPYYDSSSDLTGIRWSIAALIVAFPLFLWLSRFLLKEMIANPEKTWSGVRRWLTYLTLFVTATAMMGDVITLIFYLLQGELTTRFLLKVFFVLFVAGLSFTYYFLSMRLHVSVIQAKNMHRVFGAIASAVVLFAIIYGFWLVGSPGAVREQRFDERRVQDLQMISQEVHNISLGNNAGLPPGQIKLLKPLPASLQAVVKNAVYTAPTITDPETGDQYEYSVTSETTYRLCADFNTVQEVSYNVRWNHPAGHHCYDFDALDPTF